MPMCAFIPIAAQSLSLSVHVRRTGIFFLKEGLSIKPHQGLSHSCGTSTRIEAKERRGVLLR